MPQNTATINEWLACRVSTHISRVKRRLFDASFCSEGWHNKTYTSAAVQTYSDACEKAGGRLVSFTGILDCIGFGEFEKKRIRRGFTNFGKCFAPGGACDAYETASTWFIDMNLVSEYDCHVISNDQSQRNEPLPGSSSEGKSVPKIASPAVDLQDASTETPRNPLYILLTIIVLGLFVSFLQRRYRKQGHLYVMARESATDVEMTDIQNGVDAESPIPALD